ncbi:hypothetical protein MMC12_000509 [Toensbergia leucococca]|nr:hypothetical protein [Toensbergia leucococca]
MIEKFAAAIQQVRECQDIPHPCESRLEYHLSNKVPLSALRRLKLLIPVNHLVHNFYWLRSASVLPHFQELEIDHDGEFEYTVLPSNLELPTIVKFQYNDCWIPTHLNSDFDNRELPRQLMYCMKQLRSITLKIVSPDNYLNEFLHDLRAQRGNCLEELRLQCQYHRYGMRLDNDVFRGYRALKTIEVSLTCFVRSTHSGLFRVKRLIDYLPCSLENLVFWISHEGDGKFYVDEGPPPRHVNILDATRDVFTGFQLLHASHVPYLNSIQIKYIPYMEWSEDIRSILCFVKILCREMKIGFDVVRA